jgi:CheY-like chemotaxis protein
MVEPVEPARPRVLVIDDAPRFAAIIARLLSSEADVVVCTSAQEAFLALEDGPPFQLVLCDIVMPHMNGPEFVRQACARWPTLGGRVVMMTGGAPDAVMTSVSELGIECLRKPMQLADLLAVVRAAAKP